MNNKFSLRHLPKKNAFSGGSVLIELGSVLIGLGSVLIGLGSVLIGLGNS